ncbi:hypothetical protein LXT21_39245 [Myxococcus sp. K38C18041901]|uniref:hypothetical protein n=1 Tax=Myxococcus guangdongensis TaxID=2906760 RepID=UPI0020A7C0EA|nr:hypothetical protein [Myxococcus guangdongensis]MCP3064825.1 hypothetical protein [Myxococcus guangdongensis]
MDSDGQPALEQELAVSEAEATATRISASEASLELSFETMGTFETRNGVRSLVLKATANRYLQYVFSFVPDDAFGTANIISERRFEVVLPVGHELNSILSGLPLFITVNTFTGTPTQYTARIEVYPRFFDFRGTSPVWIDEKVDPVYVKDPISSLVYRGRADVLADGLLVTGPDGIPQVSRVDADSFKLDWSYAAVEQAMDPTTIPLAFNVIQGGQAVSQKTARLVPRVTSLALTTGDAYEVWPTPACELSVYDCIHSQPAGTLDFGLCGTYRQVSRCQYVTNICNETPSTPFALTEIDASALEAARDAWNDGSNNGAWHGLNSISAYTTPRCSQPAASLRTAFDALQWPGYRDIPTFEEGTVTNRAGLANSILLSSNYYGDGAALLAAIDAFTGGGEVQAWLGTQEVSCHNCHEFNQFAVLYYPASRKVVVLRGYTGYDS